MPSRPKFTPTPGRPLGTRSLDVKTAKAFGAVVREARTASGLSQEEFALIAQVERSYCSRIELGKSQPTLFMIMRIAAALGYEASVLVQRVEYTLAHR
jgi:transcriptional regulator with XRE-family HTH domain